MIEFLRGKILKKMPVGVVLDVNGVGYGVDMPVSDLCELGSEGSECEVWVFTRVREDALKLYGFLQTKSRRAFEILLAVNGVGPKVALAILSTLTVEQLHGSIGEQSTAALETVPGIGRRTAEKILLELKNRLTHLRSSEANISEGFALTGGVESQGGGEAFGDVMSALENLGFKRKDYTRVLASLLKSHPDRNFEVLIRLALAELTGTAKGH